MNPPIAPVHLLRLQLVMNGEFELTRVQHTSLEMPTARTRHSQTQVKLTIRTDPTNHLRMFSPPPVWLL
jgi:hypothetical protein